MSVPLPKILRRHGNLIANSRIKIDLKNLEIWEQENLKKFRSTFDNMAEGVMNFLPSFQKFKGHDFIIYSLIHYRPKEEFTALEILASMNIPFALKYTGKINPGHEIISYAMQSGEMDYGKAAVLCYIHPPNKDKLSRFLFPRHLSLFSNSDSLEGAIEAHSRALNEIRDMSKFPLGICADAKEVPLGSYMKLARFNAFSKRLHEESGFYDYAGEVEVLKETAPYDGLSENEFDFPYDFRHESIERVVLKLLIYEYTEKVMDSSFGMKYRLGRCQAEFIFEGYEKDAAVPKVKASFVYKPDEMPSATPYKYFTMAKNQALKLSKIIHKPVYVQHYEGSELLKK